MRSFLNYLWCVFLLFSISSVWAAGGSFNSPLGGIKRHTFRDGVYSGTTTNGNFRIAVYSTTIFRIQISRNESFADFSYAVIADPSTVAPTLSEDANSFSLRTDSAILVFTKDPVRFTLKNIKGEILSEDDSAFGTSWLGEDVTTYKKLQDGERFIGLGEKTGNLDRRGQACTNWNTDYFGYPSSADAIYLTTPFYVGIHHRLVYGIFMDNSSKSVFNFGASNNRFSSFAAAEGDMNYYLIANGSIPEIIRSYTLLTGRMELPPLWSLGLQQSRYSYYPDTEVLNIARTFREKAIPADVIYLDIHYMDQYKIFSWDKQRFPDPKKMTKELNEMGFHLAVILDPGIKIEKNYEPYQDGLSRDMFIKYPDHTLYAGEVWPGWCNFPDFTKPAVRSWWGAMMKTYTDTGVEGFWNDMNEPATWGQSTPNLIEFDFDGRRATHRTARNVYGLNMARSTFDGTKQLLNGRRPFLLTRSGYSGIQRYAAVWTGDNVSTDEHMMLGVRLVNSMGITGIPFSGMDVGGFTGGGSDRLFVRWISIGIFTPFFRIHARDNSRAQEPWSYGEQNEVVAKKYVQLRYKLIPYLYSTFREASESGMPVSRSLSLTHPFDDRVYDGRYQHEFMFGDAFLVAPGESNKDYYKVFLPPADWYDLYSDERYSGNREMIAEAGLDHLPVFVKGGAVVPMQSIVQHLMQKPSDTLYIHVYHGKTDYGTSYYEDDGLTYENKKENYYKRSIRYNVADNTLTLTKPIGMAASKFKYLQFLFHGFTDFKVARMNNEIMDVRRITINPSGFHPVDVLSATTMLLGDAMMISW